MTSKKIIEDQITMLKTQLDIKGICVECIQKNIEELEIVLADLERLDDLNKRIIELNIVVARKKDAIMHFENKISNLEKENLILKINLKNAINGNPVSKGVKELVNSKEWL